MRRVFYGVTFGGSDRDVCTGDMEEEAMTSKGLFSMAETDRICESFHGREGKPIVMKALFHDAFLYISEALSLDHNIVKVKIEYIYWIRN